MDFMTKLERKYGKFAIPNLTIMLIAGFIIGYLIQIFDGEALQFFDGEALEFIAMDPSKIMRGQIYRLITWVFIPPGQANIFIIINLMFYYYVGRTLENEWGDFRYTVYILSGIIFTDIGMMATYFVMKWIGRAELLSIYYQYGMYGASTYYLCMSIFLAYAFLFPHLQVLLYFIIPIKVKWLGYIEIAYLILKVIQYGEIGYFTGMVTVVMSVLNFILFYFAMKNKRRLNPAHKKRKKKYKAQVRQTQILTRHKCAVCGQTEEDNPDLEFRYCSRCKGNYEYCQNHLFTHEHKK